MDEARVYIDGHNFYHGAMKNSPELKWLDLRGLAERLLQRKATVTAVNYYTARVVDLGDRSQSQRQDIYLMALAATRVNVIEGRFAKRKKNVRLRDSGKIRKAIVWEEKGTDVNLAADLVRDACDDLPVALLLSNDSDLQRAVDIAVERGTIVYVANPHHRVKRDERGRRNRRYSPALKGSDTLTLRRSHLVDNQLPDEIRHAGGVITRPVSWR